MLTTLIKNSIKTTAYIIEMRSLLDSGDWFGSKTGNNIQTSQFFFLLTIVMSLKMQRQEAFIGSDFPVSPSSSNQTSGSDSVLRDVGYSGVNLKYCEYNFCPPIPFIQNLFKMRTKEQWRCKQFADDSKQRQTWKISSKNSDFDYCIPTFWILTLNRIPVYLRSLTSSASLVK